MIAASIPSYASEESHLPESPEHVTLSLSEDSTDSEHPGCSRRMVSGQRTYLKLAIPRFIRDSAIDENPQQGQVAEQGQVAAKAGEQRIVCNT